jgi:hypothetical protein
MKRQRKSRIESERFDLNSGKLVRIISSPKQGGHERGDIVDAVSVHSKHVIAISRQFGRFDHFMRKIFTQMAPNRQIYEILIESTSLSVGGKKFDKSLVTWNRSDFFKSDLETLNLLGSVAIVEDESCVQEGDEPVASEEQCNEEEEQSQRSVEDLGDKAKHQSVLEHFKKRVHDGCGRRRTKCSKSDHN